MSDLGGFLSGAVGPLGDRVEELVRLHEGLWRGSSTEPPRLARTYRRREKKSVERELSAVVGRLSSAEVRESYLAGSLEPARIGALFEVGSG